MAREQDRRGRSITLQRPNGSTFLFDTDLFDEEVKKMYPKDKIVKSVAYRDSGGGAKSKSGDEEW